MATTKLGAILLSLLAGWSPAFGAATAGENAASAARSLIAELKLQAGDVAMRVNPRWQPQKVVVFMPPQLEAVAPDFATNLQAVAGEVELVFDHSGGRTPLTELLADADALLGYCSADILAAASQRLLWIHSYVAGMEQCAAASPALTDGRVFSNNKRLAGPTIAEHSIAMLLALSRKLPAYAQAQREAVWDRQIAGQLDFGEVRGKTLLVVGLGGIGSEIARLGHALGMRVLATRNSSRRGPDFVEYVGLPPELPELARRADVVVNALPLTSGTNGLFDKTFFSQVKRGAIFISIGRGRSTVTEDLIAALESGQLYGAGLDVTEPEPLPKDSPLWRMERVIITPHVAAAGAGSWHRMATIAVENLRRYVAGEPLLNVVNLQQGY